MWKIQVATARGVRQQSKTRIWNPRVVRHGSGEDVGDSLVVANATITRLVAPSLQAFRKALESKELDLLNREGFLTISIAVSWTDTYTPVRIQDMIWPTITDDLPDPEPEPSPTLLLDAMENREITGPNTKDGSMRSAHSEAPTIQHDRITPDSGITSPILPVRPRRRKRAKD